MRRPGVKDNSELSLVGKAAGSMGEGLLNTWVCGTCEKVLLTEWPRGVLGAAAGESLRCAWRGHSVTRFAESNNPEAVELQGWPADGNRIV